MHETLAPPKINKPHNTNTQAKYLKLASQLRERIRSKELKAGDRLPTFAEMREKFGVTLNTVERTYSFLEQEGLIERQQGRGTFVKERQKVLTGNIGFVGGAILKPQELPFDMHLMKGVQEAVVATRQHLLYLGSSHSLDLEACSKVDGILSCNIEGSRSLLQDVPDSLPRVSLLIVNEDITSVVADDYRGGKMAVEYLVSLGHQRIAVLMEELPTLARRRFSGYNDALLEAGIKADRGWARLTEKLVMNENTQPYLEWGRRQMRQWLAEGFQELNCTALFVQNEMAAIGAMQVLQQEGWKVPDDISVMGFDGTELCDFAMPRLCAMQLPLAQIGARGVEILNQQIVGETSEPQVITLPVKLREGDSVAPPHL